MVCCTGSKSIYTSSRHTELRSAFIDWFEPIEARFGASRLHAQRYSATMTVFDLCLKRDKSSLHGLTLYLKAAAAQWRGPELGLVKCWGGRVVNGTGL